MGEGEGKRKTRANLSNPRGVGKQADSVFRVSRYETMIIVAVFDDFAVCFVLLYNYSK